MLNKVEDLTKNSIRLYFLMKISMSNTVRSLLIHPFDTPVEMYMLYALPILSATTAKWTAVEWKNLEPY